MLIENFHSTLNQRFDELSSSEKKIISEVWDHKTEFVEWPTEPRLLLPGRVRQKYHDYPEKVKMELKRRGIAIDSRSNGPAVMVYKLMRGKRPLRADDAKEWSIHHIYNGKFPFREHGRTLHAVKDGKHFTQSAGLVAIHPIAEALSDEYFYFSWVLRCEAFKKFNYDPDLVFSKEIDELGFKIL